MNNISLDPDIIQHLSLALVQSVISNTQQEIDKNSSVIYQYQTQQYYAAYLLQIINSNLPFIDNQINEILVSSAFSQLKVMVRSYWYQGGNSQISEINKFCLTNSIIRTSFNISSISNHNHLYKYLKLLKDIIYISHQDAISIYPEVVKSIEVSLHQDAIIHLLPVYLNILLGISHHGKQDYNSKYIQMVKDVHPLIYQFVSNGDQMIQQLYDSFTESANQNKEFLKNYLLFKRKYEEILYQSIKLMYKAICYTFNNDLRPVLIQWIPIALNRIEYIDATFTIGLNQQRKQFTFNPNNIGFKGNDEFNYFHGKKWALKFLNMAMSKLLVYKKGKRQWNMSTLTFYSDNFAYLIAIFQNIWIYKWPEKIHKELLKCLEVFIGSKPKQLVEKHSNLLKNFQETILPPLMAFSAKQMEILQQNAIQFIEHEININNRQSIRMIAANIWIKIATIQKSYDPEIYRSQFLHNSLLIIKNWVYNFTYQDLLMRDNGCFLLIKLKEYFAKQELICRELNPLINKVMKDNLKNLSNANFMIWLRLLQLFTAYRTILQQQVVHNCKSIVIQCFSQWDPKTQLKGEQILIMLECCKAFYRLIKAKQEEKREIGIQNVKMVIYKGLMLVQRTSYDQFIQQVINILSECITEVSDFAKDIALFLQNWFRKYSQKDISSFQNDCAKEYNSNYMQIAKGTLSIFETLIYFVRNGHQEITKIIENQIVSIIHYLFSRDNRYEIDEQMNEEAIWLLKTFLRGSQKRKNISPQIMKICRVIIIKLAGLHSSAILKLKNLLTNQQNKKRIQQLNLFINCHSFTKNGFQNYVGAIKSFIKYIPFGESINTKDLKILNSTVKYTESLIYLPFRFFSSLLNDLKQTDSGRCFSLLILIYYYQNHQQSDNIRVHQTVNEFTLTIINKTVSLYNQRPKFAKYNVQLFCLWVYEVKNELPKYFKNWSQSAVQFLLKNIFIYKRQDQVFGFGLGQICICHQQIRCILGISYFLKLMVKLATLKEIMPSELISDIVGHVIEFASRLGQEQRLTQLDQEEEYQDQGKLNQDVKMYTKMMDKYLEPFTMSQDKDVQQQDNADNYHSSLQDEENYYNEDEELYNNQDCLEYQQNQEENMQSPHQQAQTIRLYLLISLYELQKADPTYYWEIIQREDYNHQLFSILQSCYCFKQYSEYSYLKELCYYSDIADEEWEDIQNDQAD